MITPREKNLDHEAMRGVVHLMTLPILTSETLHSLWIPDLPPTWWSDSNRRLMEWLIPLSLLLAGVWWVYAQRDLLVQGLRSLRWRRTKGRIIDKEDRSFFGPGLVGSAATGVGLVEFRETGYFFEYQVGMTRYVNDTYCFGVHLDRAEARYLVGDHVPVYFDPKQPRNSVLRRGVPSTTMLSLVTLFIGAGLLIWKLWREIR